MSDPRVWIKGGATPQFLVTKPGYTVAAETVPAEGIAFSLGWAAAAGLYLAGSVLSSAMADNVVVSWPDLGYVPWARVLGRTTFTAGKIGNFIFSDIVTYTDRIEAAEKAAFTELYYFVSRQRTV